MTGNISALSLIVAGCFATQAVAQVPPSGPSAPQTTPQSGSAVPAGKEDPFSIDLSLAAVSDYRFRGISLSNKDPAFQPSVTLTHKSGLYSSVWGSNIADNGGDNIEVDLVGGYSGQTGSVSYGINATYYLYPGASGLNYVEFIGTAGADVGSAKIGVTVGYVPKQKNLGDLDNFYIAVNGSLPIRGTPISLTGSFGIEDGAFASAKRDWSVGVNADVAGFTLGVSYVDTARIATNPLGDPVAVFSISRVF
jgi:uncharacterized protein (TIGR02001 family)